MNELAELISNSPYVDFGSADDSVDSIWYEKAEEALGVKLTESYLWFLKDYSGGEICGEEIYSIYGMDFESINGGDIVYHHILNLRQGLTEPERIVVCDTDFGETFYFDYSKFDGIECPIYLKLPSGRSEFYANDFYEFLKNRISAVSK